MRNLTSLLILSACVVMRAHAADTNESVAPGLPMLKVGDPAPEFAIPPYEGASDDKSKLSDYRGESVLVAFFPKAFSMGCTRQLIEYRNEYQVFRNADTRIIAISSDSQEENDRFRTQYKLPFPVIGDPDRAIIDGWGVPSRQYLGSLYAQRCVFLVDAEGIIQYVELEYSVLRSKTALIDAVRELAEARPDDKGSD